MELSELNIWAVIVAAVSAFVVGALWYSSALFGKAWMQAAGLNEEELQDRNMAEVFSAAFILELVMALNLGVFLNDPGTTMGWGIVAGFLAGFGWVALGMGVISLFEKRSFRYMLINGGYMVVSFMVMGAILGAWR